MADWYVDPITGVDAPGNGTDPGTPFLTLTYTEGAASDGDTAYLAAGTYAVDTQLLAVKQIAWVGADRDTTVIEFPGANRHLYVSGANAKTFTAMTLQWTNPAAGTKYLVESGAGDCATTLTNCRLIDGRLASFYSRLGSTGLVFDTCIFDISFTPTLAYGLGGYTLRDCTINVPTGAANGVLSQAVAASDGTVTVDGNTVYCDVNEEVLSLGSGVYSAPAITDNTFRLTSAFNTNVIALDNHTGESVTGNDIYIDSILTSSQAVILQQSLGGTSVASVSDNVVRTKNSNNHTLIVGDEGGVSAEDAYDGSTLSNNRVYAAGYFGLSAGTNHAIMAAYNRCFIRGNEVHGAGIGLIQKNNGPDYSSYDASDNIVRNSATGFRAKGAPGSVVTGNRFESYDGTNSYGVLLTNNDGVAPSVNSVVVNNVFDIDSGRGISYTDTSGSGLVSDWNYFSLNGTAVAGNNGTARTTLADWQAATGQDLHSGTFVRGTRATGQMASALGFVTYETFDTALKAMNAGTRLRRGATIRGNGLLLDGTDQHALVGTTAFQVGKVPKLSMRVEFTPDFAYDENAKRYLFAAGTGYSIIKQDNAGSNALTLTLGGNLVATIASATYSPYWRVGERNEILVSSENTTTVWLNGVAILSAGGAAWTHTTQTQVHVGSSATPANGFLGSIHSFAIGMHTFTALEASKLYAGTMFRFPWSGEYRMLAADPTADSSGNGNALTLGTGGAAPTKLTERGYSTDGGDTILSPNLKSSMTRYTAVAVIRKPNTTLTKAFCSFETPTMDHVGGVFYYITGRAFRFFCGSLNSNQRSVYIRPGSQEPATAIVIGTYDGTRTTMWVNGEKGTNAPVPIVPDVTSLSRLSAFSRGDGATTACVGGTHVLYAAVGDFGITDAEVRFLTAKLRGEIEKV